MNVLKAIAPFSGLITMVIVWGFILPLMNSRSNKRVWGKYIRAEYAENFLRQYLEKYEFCDLDTNLLIAKGLVGITLPYIAKRNGIFHSFYIQDIGRIRRGSHASKMINGKITRLKYGL